MGNGLVEITLDARAMRRMQRALRNGRDILEKHLKEAMLTLGLNTERVAKERCPVDTGNLRSSISPEWTGTLAMHVGTNVEYAPYVEYGTRLMAAQPFLEPAYLDTKRKAPAVVKQAIKAAMREIEGRAK